jgi:hypothetical protein
MWKLNWFLRDFGYDAELLGCDEIDDQNLVGLSGVVKITNTVVNGVRWSTWRDLRQKLSGQSFRLELMARPPVVGSGHDLQLQPDQPLLELSPPLPAPLSGWLAGKRLSRCHAVWTGLRASPGSALQARRPNYYLLPRMLPIRNSHCATANGIAGMACRSREFGCLNASVRKTVAASCNRDAICRSSSCAHSRKGTNSSPMWMRLGN